MLLQLPGLAIVGLLGGCRGSGRPAPESTTDPQALARRRARADERTLLAAYDATVTRHPALRAQLIPLRQQHAGHLSAVDGQSQPAPAPSAPVISTTPATAVLALAAAERRAASVRLADCVSVAADFAGLLASIGASEATHAAVLPALARAAAGTSAPTPGGAHGVSTRVSRTQPATADLLALQAALAGEHAAVYAYGVIGAHLDAAGQPLAARALGAHLTARDTLHAAIAATGGQPVAAEPAYVLPFVVRTPPAALRLAVLVEDRLAALYLALVTAAEDRPTRALAAAALQTTAVATAGWRQRGRLTPLTEAFPGR
jgi:hypothetical protein